MASNIAPGKIAAGHRPHSRRGVSVGELAVRPSEIRAVAIEAQMELFTRLDAEIQRDLLIIRDCNQRIAERERRKQQLREDNARLERMRVA